MDMSRELLRTARCGRLIRAGGPIAFLLFALAADATLRVVATPAANVTDVTSSTPPQIGATGAYGKLPLQFEANRGQTDPRVKFLARTGSQMLFLTQTEAVWVQTKRDSSSRKSGAVAQPKLLASKPKPAMMAVLRMTFAGGNPARQAVGDDELPGRVNYFIGNDPTKWRTNVPTYGRVRYRDIYPGIDLSYFGTQRQLEYDLVVGPGANPARIALGFKGADRIELDPQGDLVLHTAAGWIRQRKPLIYQEIDGVRREIPGGYVLTGQSKVGFLVGTYDASRPLVIDPVIVYSTYLGGIGSEAAIGIAVDASGNAYVTGATASTNFPTSAGAIHSVGGGGDVFVTKLNATGSALLFSTFIGGSAADQGNGVAVDASGNAYVTGSTFSTNFPTTAAAFQRTFTGWAVEAFVTKLNATGSALLYSTYLGGSTAGPARSAMSQGTGIALDTSGNAYVTGITTAADYPTTTGAFQGSLPSGQDAFVTKLNVIGSTPVYSTYLGPSTANVYCCPAIAVDAAGNAYVTGPTNSGSFPTTAGAFQTSLNGFENPFIAKLNTNGSALVYSTYLGGNGDDIPTRIAVDASGSAYVTGSTTSTNFPTTAGAFQTGSGGGSDAFVTKLNALGSALVYSTYLGGTADDGGGGIAVDAEGNAYVSGSTLSAGFPTTPGAFQTSLFGTSDAFVTKLNPLGSALIYSTYLGGTADDGASGIAIDSSSNAYVAGTTTSLDFPVTGTAAQISRGGGGDAFVTKVVFPTTGYEIVINRVTRPASSAANVNTTCSSAHKILGGGFLGETPDFVKFFSSIPGDGLGNLSDHGWNAYAQNADSTGPRVVQVVAICASASWLAGHELKMIQSTLGASSTSDVTVACSSGHKVIGGGFVVETPDALKVIMAQPSDSGAMFSDHIWNVRAQNTDTHPRQVWAIAVCASSSALPGYEIKTANVSLPAAAVNGVNVACSSGNKVLGGGFWIENPASVRIFHSLPSDGHSNLSDHNWDVLAQNADPINARFTTVSAICARL
jgi:hypothetical protein